jgi:adenine-specific DNA-methyltransferase
MIARYKNPDNDPRGPWLLSDLAARNYYAQGRYSITTPSGKIIQGPPAGSYWRVSQDKFYELDKDNRIWWGQTGNNRPGIKRFLTDVREGVVPQTYWPWQDVGSTRNAKQEFSQLMEAGSGENLFITPKPTRLIRKMIKIATDKDSIILDFFAGTGTTAHAVINENLEDNGKRRFILVQLPEPNNQENYQSISDITRERVKKVISKVNESKEKEFSLTSNQELGFQFYKQAPSCFKLWNTKISKDAAELEQQLEMHIEHIHEGRSQTDILYEILLKSGFPLTTKIDNLNLAGEHDLTLELIQAIAGKKPDRVICLDAGFAGNDQLKANAVQLFKTHEITSFKTI